MPRLIVVRPGVPGTKSAWSQQGMEAEPDAYRRVDADLLRTMLGGRQRSRADDEFAREQRDALIVASLQDGRDLLLEDSKFDHKDEQHLRQLVRGMGTLEIVSPEPQTEGSGSVPLYERPAPAGKDNRRHKHMAKRAHVQKYDPDPHLPPAVICDLDGTLALIHGRSPYGAARCERDELNTVVAGILRSLVEPKPAVLLVSGREARFREQTVRWLAKHGIEYDELHMRPTGDFRKDTVVKHEIFEREIRHRFRVEFVLDDRNQVVEMWRSLGLTCLQVAEGNF